MSYINELETIFEVMTGPQHSPYLVFARHRVFGHEQHGLHDLDVAPYLEKIGATDLEKLDDRYRNMMVGICNKVPNLQFDNVSDARSKNGISFHNIHLSSKSEDIDWDPQSDQLLDAGDEWEEEEYPPFLEIIIIARWRVIEEHNKLEKRKAGPGNIMATLGGDQLKEYIFNTYMHKL